MSENRKIIKFRSHVDKNENSNKEKENTGRKLDKKYLKLKFNKNLLIEILKKSRLRKISERKNKNKNSNSSRFNNFNNTEKQLDSKDKIINKIYKNFKDFPEMKKFHNITLEKLTDLIKSNDDLDNSSQYQNIKYNSINLKLKSMKKSNLNYFKSQEPNKTKNGCAKYTNNIKNINLNDLNLNKENILPYLTTKSSESNPVNLKYSSLSKPKKNNIIENKDLIHKSKFMSKTSKLNQTNQWIESIRDSIKKYDVLHRRSRIDRLIFFIENPEGCFEENLMEERPGDKYIMLKNQMKRRKNRFENIIREIKLNQKKSEYLMKKYIFDLLSRKKSVYKG